MSATKTQYALLLGVLVAELLGSVSPGLARVCRLSDSYRDLDSGLQSNTQLATTTRFMRHLWVVDSEYKAPLDGLVATFQHGQYPGVEGIWLQRLAPGSGTPHWEDVVRVTPNPNVVSDGIMDSTHAIDLVVSGARETEFRYGVYYVHLPYDAGADTWTLARTDTVITAGAGRATLARELGVPNPRLWCTVTVDADTTDTTIVQLKAYYSTDDGQTWNDSGQLFGTPNTTHEKSGKVIAFEDKIGLLYHDDNGVDVRRKLFAYRTNSDDPLAPWTTTVIDTMSIPYGEKPWMHTHWSAAAGSDGVVHTVYQNGTVSYAQGQVVGGVSEWAVTPTGSEVGSFPPTGGSYPQISLSSDNVPYAFLEKSDTTVVTVFLNGRWSDLVQVAAPPDSICGKRRLTTPEHFCDRLPFAYQIYQCGTNLNGLGFGIASGCCLGCCGP